MQWHIESRINKTINIVNYTCSKKAGQTSDQVEKNQMNGDMPYYPWNSSSKEQYKN